MARGESVRGLAAITFDDGYRCFLDHAYPVLARRGLPTTHFVVTSCLETGQPTWNWRLSRLLVGAPSAERQEHKRRVGAMDAGAREAWLVQAEAASPRALSDPPPMLRPDDLARVDDALVEWGAHTVSHASLGLLDDAAVEREVSGSADRLAEWTGGPVRSFSYPNGSYSPAATAAVERAGFESAAAVGQRAATPSGSRWAVPRFDINVTTATRIRLEASGAVGHARGLARWGR